VSARSRRQSREIGRGERRSIEGVTSSSMEGSSGRRSRVIFTDTREKRPRRFRNGRQARAKTRAGRHDEKRQKSQRYGPRVRGHAVEQSTRVEDTHHDRQPRRPTSANRAS